MDLSNAVLTPHSLDQMRLRGIDQALVRAVLASSDVQAVRVGRVVVQEIVGGYLLRVFVDVDRNPPEVVTAYRTSKIDKYRSKP